MAQAPADTIVQRDLDEVVVTATRGRAPLVAPGIPAEVVTSAEAEARGVARLSDLLAEVGGYTVDHAFGAGLQIQGLGPEYSMVLVDGEPVIGRLNGTLDLDRLGLAGLDRVEIIRGPFSSLYGSEALAGVVNLISRPPREAFRALGTLRLESSGTSDAATDVGFRRVWGHGAMTVRHYRSGAYDLDAGTAAPTFPAYSGADATGRLQLRLPYGLQARVRVRGGIEDQRDGTDVALPPGSAPLTGQGLRSDRSVAATLERGPAGRRIAATYHGSHYGTETSLSAAGGDTVVSSFDQWVHRAEAQADWLLGTRHLLAAGAGVTLETVAADRIGGGAADSRGVFAFVQEQWRPHGAADVTVSARLDVPGDFAARLSPAASILLRPRGGLRVRASVGSGFKAPTFQQRYLDFTNAPAGYTVVGASDIDAVLARYEDDGLVERYEYAGDLQASLRPETSWSVNAGGEADVGRTAGLTLNAFLNHVVDLIDIVPVAVLTNGRQVYSYVNLDRVQTRGIELGGWWAAAPWLRAGARYQLLDAVDLGAIEEIEAGRVFRREEGVDRRLRRDEYGGLFGRSRHSGSVDLSVVTPLPGLSATLRGVFRSRYGDFDRNGNLLLDDAAEYVPGQVLLHGTITYAAARWLTLQAGVDNALDYTDPQRAPAIPGRRLYAGMRVSRTIP